MCGRTAELAAELAKLAARSWHRQLHGLHPFGKRSERTLEPDSARRAHGRKVRDALEKDSGHYGDCEREVRLL